MLQIIFTALVFILVISALVLIHEYGHYKAAKNAGIKVEEFGFGLPPRIWGKKKGDTLFSVNWIPFGGFVKLYGQNASDPKMFTDPQSFSSKPLGDRVKVIIGGVVMNIFLAWLLITIALTIGIDKQYEEGEFLAALNSGEVAIEEGIIVDEVLDESLAAELGFEAGDKIVDPVVIDLAEGVFFGEYQVLRGEEIIEIEFDPTASYQYYFSGEDIDSFKEFGLEVKRFNTFSRLSFQEVSEDSFFGKLGLESGDILLALKNDEMATTHIFSQEIFDDFVQSGEDFTLIVERDHQLEEIAFSNQSMESVIVNDLIFDGEAKNSGLLLGDVLLEIDGKKVSGVLEVINLIAEKYKEDPEHVFAFKVLRGENSETSEELVLEVPTNQNGKIGVVFGQLANYEVYDGVVFNEISRVSSVVKEQKDQVPFYWAPFRAIGDTYRYTVLTAEGMFEFLFKQLPKNDIPESAGGIVKIAQYTHLSLEQGLATLLMFVAAISLSLAVLNILPFPALDGGHLVFLIIEWIRGKRVDPKVQNIISVIGFVLLLFLIVLVTYHDIAGLFN